MLCFEQQPPLPPPLLLSLRRLGRSAPPVVSEVRYTILSVVVGTGIGVPTATYSVVDLILLLLLRNYTLLSIDIAATPAAAPAAGGFGGFGGTL